MQPILEILRQQKLLPQNDSMKDIEPDEVELTQEEADAALKAARVAKHRAEQTRLYWEKVKQVTEIKKLTSEEFLQFVLARAEREIKDFEIRQNQFRVYELLSHYFTGDERFTEAGYSLAKGIVLFGGVGCGKTSIMKMFNHNQLYSYVVISCRKIASMFSEEGDSVLYRYSGQYTPNIVENVFKCQSWGICFDDLGTESDKQHFGNKANVMEQILLNRYDNLNSLRCRTHITTNLTPEDTEQQYGTRVRSRMREMFNLIDVSGEDLRK